VVTQILFQIPIDLLDEIGISVVRDNLVGLNRENITVDALIEEQRRLSASKNPFERVVGSLCIGAILKEQLVRLPNSAISRLLTDQIWSQLNLLEPESVIVEIASERLVEKREASLVCPECGSEFWRADE
jgi:hypothetical protein